MTGSPPGLMLTPNTSSVSQLHNILCSVLLASNIHLTCSSGNSYMFFKPFEVFLYIFRNLHFLCLYSPESLNRKSFCCGCHPFCYFRLLHFKKKYWSFLFKVLSDAVIKNPPFGAGDEGVSDSIAGLGTCPGVGNGNLHSHSSVLHWKIPWRMEPGELWCLGFAKSWIQLNEWACT